MSTSSESLFLIDEALIRGFSFNKFLIIHVNTHNICLVIFTKNARTQIISTKSLQVSIKYEQNKMSPG